MGLTKLRMLSGQLFPPAINRVHKLSAWPVWHSLVNYRQFTVFKDLRAERAKSTLSLEGSEGMQVGAREEQGGLALGTLLGHFLKVWYSTTLML